MRWSWEEGDLPDARVFADGKEIEDILWADDATGEYAYRLPGDRRARRKASRVLIIWLGDPPTKPVS